MPDGSVQSLSAPRQVSPVRGARILSARRPLPYRSFSAFAVRGCLRMPERRMGIADQPYWPRFFCKRFSGSSRSPRLLSHRRVSVSCRPVPRGRAALVRRRMGVDACARMWRGRGCVLLAQAVCLRLSRRLLRGPGLRLCRPARLCRRARLCRFHRQNKKGLANSPSLICLLFGCGGRI